ncbi:MAG: DNA-processing protein DprA, partial [Lachnospiraceae bacterium]|nr:DNA-processing protein DprA [Lachnospiraceae bacterium]
QKGIRYVTREEGDYPEKLLGTEDAPFGLFLLGPPPDWSAPSAGIVGSRRCTAYGRDMASFFGRELARKGLLIVSGMALGVDGYAGRGALQGHGHHAAVLGGGVDICYPRENIDLYTALKEQGTLVSERPVGRQAMPYDFPIRNRIISGLSDVLLIIEAAPNSGSLITAELANRQGREVFALPGRAGERMSEGTNRLIRDGAQILLSPEDVLQRLGLQVGTDTVKRPRVRLNELEKLLFEEIGRSPVDSETLHQRTGIPFTVLPEILISLEIKGLIKKEAAGGYTRVV